MLGTVDRCSDCNSPMKPHHSRRCPTHRAESYSQRWERMKAEFVTHAHGSMMRSPWSRYFAIYQPSSVGTWGVLDLLPEGSDVPEGFELVTAEVIPGENVPGIARWFNRFADRLAVFPQ